MAITLELLIAFELLILKYFSRKMNIKTVCLQLHGVNSIYPFHDEIAQHL